MNVDYQYLVARLQSALATDPRVNMLDVKVMVVGGRVHLTGEVACEERRSAVESVVTELVPDVEVRNELTVFDVAQPLQPEVIRD